MDLRTIKTFITIVKLGNFQRAADELRYAQSTVIMQIQKLEHDLGVKLFERGKNIRLTEAGRIFSEQSSFIVRDLDSLQTTMTDLVNGSAGSIRFGAMEPAASFRLPEILAPFMANHPKISISIQIGNTFNLSELIFKGEIDLAICSVPETSIGLCFEPLFSEQLALLVPSTNPLAEKKEIFASDLKEQRFLITSRNCPYRKKLETSLQELGISYSAIEISSLASLKYYVKADYGIALVPLITVTPPPPGTVIKMVQDLSLDLVTGILRSSDRLALGPSGDKLVNYLKHKFQSVLSS